MRFKVILYIFLFPFFYYSQTGYFNEIKSASGANIFGHVGCLEQDSLYLYAVVNSGYATSGICTGGNGTSYILKINKSTGKVISSDSICANPYMMQVNDGVKFNNALYLGGEMGNISQRFSFISKFDLNTSQVVWQKVFSSDWNATITDYVTQVRYNKGLNGVFFSATNTNTLQFPSPMANGTADTSGISLVARTINPMINVQMQNLKFDVSPYNNYIYGISKEVGARNICLFKNTNSSFWSFGAFWGPNTNILDITTDSTQFSCIMGQYVLSVAGKNNECICILSDTLLNVVRLKKFSNFRFKSGITNGYSAVLTGVTFIDPNNGDEVVNLKIDTNLTILASKKITLNPFNLHGITTRTLWDGSSFYNLISRASANGPEVNIYKSSFTSFLCNEMPVSISTFSVAYSNTLANVSSTATANSFTPTLSYGTNGLKDSLYCPVITTDILLVESPNHNFHIFPNPSENSININISDKLSPLEIEIFNCLGQSVKKQIYSNKIDISLLNEGAYLLKLTLVDTRPFYQKFIVKK